MARGTGIRTGRRPLRRVVLQGVDHRHERRDADAAGDEDEMVAALRQRERVVRRRDEPFVALLRVVDEIDRATAAAILALDRDLIAFGFGGIAAQRIFAHQPVRHLQIDMRARGEGRKIAAVAPPHLEKWMSAKPEQLPAVAAEYQAGIAGNPAAA